MNLKKDTPEKNGKYLVKYEGIEELIPTEFIRRGEDPEIDEINDKISSMWDCKWLDTKGKIEGWIEIE